VKTWKMRRLLTSVLVLLTAYNASLIGMHLHLLVRY